MFGPVHTIGVQIMEWLQKVVIGAALLTALLYVILAVMHALICVGCTEKKNYTKKHAVAVTHALIATQIVTAVVIRVT